ncbi:MAG: hypothetical protein M0Z46_22665 [Actinomycetota bacterium]|nr:hypothetical protein [Actinomycetota bacterium]
MRSTARGQVCPPTLLAGCGPGRGSAGSREERGPEVARAEAEEDGASERRVAAEVAAVLACATDDVLATAPLTLPLALSVCMERHGTGAEGLIAAMQSLRRAILAVSGLDPLSEPVPLPAGDSRAVALRLADELRGLLARVARAWAAAPDVVASAAAARLA